jgi:hypothetical protein
MICPGEVKRVFEAIYVMVLVTEDFVSRPDESAFTIRTKK